MEVTILMPCLNEQDTILKCINDAFNVLDKFDLDGEVLISDNGSSDNSVSIVNSTNARIVIAKNKGYGSAIRKGIKRAKGKYILLLDADCSYDVYDIMKFIEKLREGNDLVVGNRFYLIEKGAMPISHFFGVKFLTFVGNLLYGTRLHDYHSGIRAFNRRKIIDLNLSTTGMEFASEIIIKARKARYKIAEVNTSLKRDGRSGKPHLKTFRDGFRHLKCLFVNRVK